MLRRCATLGTHHVLSGAGAVPVALLVPVPFLAVLVVVFMLDHLRGCFVSPWVLLFVSMRLLLLVLFG